MSKGQACMTRPAPIDQPVDHRPRSGGSGPHIVETSDTFHFILYPKKVRIDQIIMNTWLRVCFRRYCYCQWRGRD
jgi:hypothetical protein